jgi:hypothetical protein
MGLTSFFNNQMGVIQGYLLSPYLFSVDLNDIDQTIEDGVWIGNTVIKIVIYADDLIFMATNSKGLQRSINSLEKYSEKWGMTQNLDKSKIFLFGNRGRPERNEK